MTPHEKLLATIGVPVLVVAVVVLVAVAGDFYGWWTLPWWWFPSEWRRQGGRWARLEQEEGYYPDFTHEDVLASVPDVERWLEEDEAEPGLEYADELQVIRGELMADDAEAGYPGDGTSIFEQMGGTITGPAAYHAPDPLEAVRDDPQVVLWDIRQQVARIGEIRVALAVLAAEVAAPEYWRQAA